MKLNPREMAKLFCYLLMRVSHVIVANFYVANVSFNAIHENKILAKIYSNPFPTIIAASYAGVQ